MNTLESMTVLIVGAGNMGEAVGKAVRAAGVAEKHLLVHNSTAESSARAAKAIGALSTWNSGIEVGGEDPGAEILRRAVTAADVVILGIKPYQLSSVLPPFAESLKADTLVISLAAGATIEKLSGFLGGHRMIVRTMPNTPVAVGKGVVAIMAAADVPAAQRGVARALLEGSASIVEIPESKVHAVIGASGSSPAFFFLMAEAMIDEAVAQGFSREEASTLVVETMRGSAELLSATGQLPAEARYAVTSPGGTTARGVAALEESGFRTSVASAMRAAAAKSRELEELG